MTKNKKGKKRTFIFKKSYILWVIILILLIAQGVSAWHIMKLREYAVDYSNFSMRILLSDAEEDRYKHPIIDVTENRVYIPEARIYFPLNEASRNIRYDYREQRGGFWSKALYFSTSSVVGRQSGAQYEMCDKMVTLVPVEEVKTQRDKAVATIEPTKDNLSQIFSYPDNTCWDQKWYADLKQDLVEVVKQAKNY